MKKRFLSLLLAAALVLSAGCITVLAAEARASLTLGSYTASAASGSNKGEVKISYDVRASAFADRVGVSKIKVYAVDGSSVTIIPGNTTNGLVREGAFRHRSSYTYTGISGKYYYAEVTVFADIDPDTDSRTITTATVKAP